MRAAAALWNEQPAHRPIEWRARSLALFNDQPTRELVDEWDLLLIDHPGIGECHRDGTLVALDDHLDAALLADLAADSAGRSHASYSMSGHQYALALDAACQTSAARLDLLAARGIGVPRTWTEVRDLARAFPGAVVWPLFPGDAITSLLGVSHQMRGAQDQDLEGGDDLVSLDAVEMLLEVLQYLHPSSLELNPPQTLDLMSSADEILYAPQLFCYAGYQHRSRERVVSFGPTPAIAGGDPDATGALLGGAGLAVSAKSRAIPEAVEFAAWLMGTSNQADLIPASGGQPGRRSAWLAQVNDPDHGAFFRDVLPVIESAIVRPRDQHWPTRQDRAGTALRACLADGSSAKDILDVVRSELRCVART
jgi:multiple sugar transport system substrate-binding protein